MWDVRQTAKGSSLEARGGRPLPMLSRVLATIQTEGLLAAGERVLVAVSGGPDSTALLHALLKLAPRLGCALEAAVVEHGLRPEAAAEAKAVANACVALDVPCQVLKVDVPVGRKRGESLQTAARRLRLSVLEEAASRRSCQKIALGHTANDQAETVLFRIVRGTGVAGLCGIPYRRGLLVRPLLDVGREDVLAFLRRRRVAYLEDPSNRDRRYARTRVRNEWLPFLAAENPRIVQALLSLSYSARAARASQPPPVQSWRADPRVGGRAAEAIERLVAGGAGSKRISFRDGFAEIRYGRVTLHRRSDAQPQEVGGGGATEPVAIDGAGLYRWPAGRSTVELRMVEGAAGPPARSATFDPRWLEQGLVLRALRPGDRMRPRGGRGSRKLQDLLVDAKIPRGQRMGLPALVAGGGTGPILFVPGLRPSEEGRPSARAQRWIEVRVSVGG
jgi:tRNA(Ile)-lysidine synthase